MPVIMAAGVAIGTMCVWAGLLISYRHDTAAGATMSSLAVTVFFTLLSAKEAADWSTRRRSSVPAGA